MMKKEALAHNIIDDLNARNENWDRLEAMSNQFQSIVDGEIQAVLDSEIVRTDIADKLLNIEAEYAPRLNTIDSQLAEIETQKLDKGGNEQVTLGMLSQEVKTAITGGSLPVVTGESVNTSNLIDGSVIPDKTNFTDIYEDGNLIDHSRLLGGHYNNDGVFVVSSGYYSSGLVKVTENTTYYTRNGISYIQFFNSSRVFIDFIPYASVFTTPAGCNYLAISVASTNASKLTLRKNYSGSISEPFIGERSYTLNKKILVKSENVDFSNKLKKEDVNIFNYTTNVFNKNDLSMIVSGGYYTESGYFISSTTYLSVKSYVEPNVNYIFNFTGFQLMVVDKLGNILYSVSNYSGGAITMPNNAYIVYQTIHINNIPTYMAIRGNTLPSGYIAYGCTLKPEYIPDSKSAYGKRYFFLGDSITELHKWVDSFVDIVIPSSYENFARSSATLCDYSDTVYDGIRPIDTSSHKNVIGNQVEQIKLGGYAAPDVIIIAAGTNDNTPTTDIIENNFTSNGAYISLQSANRMTFSGAMRYAYETLISLYPNAKIFFCTPIQSAENTRSYSNTKIKADKIEEVSNRLGIQTIKTHLCGIYGAFETRDANGKYLVDGLHENVVGGLIHGQFVARFIISYFNN